MEKTSWASLANVFSLVVGMDRFETHARHAATILFFVSRQSYRNRALALTLSFAISFIVNIAGVALQKA